MTEVKEAQIFSKLDFLCVFDLRSVKRNLKIVDLSPLKFKITALYILGENTKAELT